jgi:glycine C-acetyltransferase/8-amino-7-oxononanoate synthase
VEDEVDVVTGSLGRALGSYGGYACCDSVTARYLFNSARTLLQSTAPPPVAAAAALAALELLEAQPRRIEKLHANAAALRAALAREGFDVSDEPTHLVSLVVGAPQLANRIVDAALEGGVLAEVVLPPAVPGGAARVRLAVMASHTRSELREAAGVLARAARRAGFAPGSNAVQVFDRAA